MSIATSPIRFATPYKPGGTMVISANSLSSRIIDSDSDKWGRWSNQTFQGKGNIRVTIYSVYQVVDSRSASQGQNTVASQQQALMTEANDPATDPRQAFCRDLRFSIQTLQSKGHDIILVGDFNEALGTEPGGITEVAAECNLVDIMSAMHPDLQQPVTYMHGRKRLDYLLTSPRVSEAARLCGYEEFQHRIYSDHRAYFVGFDTQALRYTNAGTGTIRCTRTPLQ